MRCMTWVGSIGGICKRSQSAGSKEDQAYSGHRRLRVPTMYELALLGEPSAAQVDELAEHVQRMLQPFGLTLGDEVLWHVQPEAFRPDQERSSAAIFFGGPLARLTDVAQVLRSGIPIVPVVSSLRLVGQEIPEALRSLNCLALNEASMSRVAATTLECCGLLPRQRRVFLSYRRDEARQAALQLFDALTLRQFDVFLDTHGVPPAEDFQAVLWHRLCDADVLVMLDTATYFDSRWTSAEFGRALAKGVAVLRVGWPDATPSIRTATASRAELLPGELDLQSGKISDDAAKRICDQIEQVRSQSLAVRRLNLVSNVRIGVEKIGGSFLGTGQHGAIHVQLPDGRPITIFTTLGVPTSAALHDASINSLGGEVGVVYDAIGLLPAWQQHLDWLGTQVTVTKWLKVAEISWLLADWESAQ
jgi:hypothetical protein